MRGAETLLASPVDDVCAMLDDRRAATTFATTERVDKTNR